MKIQVGPHEFASKSAAISHYRSILYSYWVGAELSESDATELDWLLDRHPEAGEKRGGGVAAFEIRSSLFNTTAEAKVKKGDRQLKLAV